ncbi:MAG: cadherin-like domain-containing protein [Halioglobus sp.]
MAMTCPYNFTVSDGVAEVQSTAFVDVVAVQRRPGRKVDLGSIKEDTSITFKADQLLAASASDIDGDDLKVTSVSVDESWVPFRTMVMGPYTFKPAVNFNGDDVPLSFTVSDGVASSKHCVCRCRQRLSTTARSQKSGPRSHQGRHLECLQG